MPEQLKLPVVSIEGIGPDAAADLERAGIYVVGDLLRVDAAAVHRAVAASHSLEQARAWCQMAAFLQVRGVTPQWAEALQQAGLATVGDLRWRSFSDLRDLFAAARDGGRISEVPTDDAAGDMLKDAAVIEFTGALNGTVLSEDGGLVEGATVRVGREEEVTDARGRFRLIRIPLWARSTLTVIHPEYRSPPFRLGAVEPSNVIHSRAFTVRSGRSRRPRALMEVRGDRLPPVGDAPISARQIGPDDLIDRDLLALVELSTDGQRAKLVSKLLVYEDGDFWFPYVWRPVGDLRPDARPGDCYVVHDGTLEPIEVDPATLRGWPGMLRVMRQTTGPEPDADTVAVRIERWVETLRRTGAFQRTERF